MEYSSIEAFEVRAEVFHRMTGMTAPGKDESAAANNCTTYEERIAAFDDWLKEHGAIVRAVMKATETHCWRANDDDA